jgi:hypothetical protein
LRDKGPSSAGPAATGEPAWRGLLLSTRSISAQLDGPLPQPMPDSLSKVCSICSREVVKRIFN